MVWFVVCCEKSINFRESRHLIFFDDVEVNLQLKNGQGVPFIKEHNIIKKRTKLALNHSTFEASGFLARFFITNGEHLLEPKIFFSILDNA